MRQFAALMSLGLTAAAPPSSTDARLRTIIAPVSAVQLKTNVETLVNFGTRHTLSSQTDPKRGIGAALEWTREEFQRYSKACSDCLTIVDPDQIVTGPRIPTPTKVRDMVAIQRGTERPNDVVIITGHIDSRVSDPMNASSDAPGANDDGSGTATVLEAARTLSRHKFPGTIVYAALSGEEQGLNGGKVIADYAKTQGWNVIANLNNDIVGNSCGSDGLCDATHVRIFSEGPRWQGHEALASLQRSLGGENDSPSRNLSRYLGKLAERLKIGLDVRQIWRNDRLGRGGDHTEFLNLGFPAVRFTVGIENYNWQHQDVRVEHGVHYGDTIDHMDFVYLAKVAKLNIAALAAMASAPPPPEPQIEGAVSTETIVLWPRVPGAFRYRVWWRRTDANNWEVAREVSAAACGDGGATNCKLVLPHIRVDDWIFGVLALSKDGFESPVASAVPGGAFKPYASPANK